MHRFLATLCLILAAQGLTWALIGGFDPFGIWDGLAAQALYGTDDLPVQALPLARLLVVLLGGTDAGFFVLLYFLVRHGIAARLPWAHRGAVVGVLVWFVVDSAGSMYLGAYFNVFMVNIPALLMLGLPLFALRPSRC